MSESKTPRTDANSSTRSGWVTDVVDADFARTLEIELTKANREKDEAVKSYQTVKDWAFRLDANLNTILDRCCDLADGTSDATDVEKFANELVGLNNSLMLGDVMSLRAERDYLRNSLTEWEKIADELVDCLKHNGITLEKLQNCQFSSIITDEDISDKYASALTTYNQKKGKQ